MQVESAITVIRVTVRYLTRSCNSKPAIRATPAVRVPIARYRTMPMRMAQRPLILLAEGGAFHEKGGDIEKE